MCLSLLFGGHVGEQAVPEDLEAVLTKGSKALLLDEEGKLHTEMLCWTRHGKSVIGKNMMY